MAAQSICYSPLCGHKVEGEVRDCPKCGKKMRTPRTVRILGLVMFLCGLVITGLVGAITWNMSWVLNHPGQTDYGGSRFTGDAGQARMILQLFWVLIGFGIAAMAAGIWQMVTARRDRWLVLGVLLLALIVFLVARETKLMLS